MEDGEERMKGGVKEIHSRGPRLPSGPERPGVLRDEEGAMESVPGG